MREVLLAVLYGDGVTFAGFKIQAPYFDFESLFCVYTPSDVLK